MKNLLLLIAVFVFILSSCCKSNKTADTCCSANEVVCTNTVLSAEDQAKLTPDRVIRDLKKGNEDFINNKLTRKNTTERVSLAAKGQYPEAVILSCLDSRVPVEDIFHRGIGDVFVARVAGNIVNPDILGSMEFACKVSGSKLIVVLGHGSCGAIKSAIDDVELGNITGLLNRIKPAVNRSKASYQGEAKSSNYEFVDHVCYSNIAVVMEEIRKDSPILKEMEDKGEIKIVGAYYNMETGKVDFTHI